MDAEEMDYVEEATIEDGKGEVDTIADMFLAYLRTKQYGVVPRRFMRAYSIIVKLCDQDEGSQQLFFHFQDKMQHYILTNVAPKIEEKASDSKEFLAEYVAQWRNFSLFLFSMKK